MLDANDFDPFWDDDVGALCVRHHQLKTHGGWKIRGSQEDGSCTWMSPPGRQYEHDPPPF